MEKINLDGDWQLFHYPEGSQQVGYPDDLASLHLEPILARVPGNVELDMQRAGQLPDPFFAGNIRKLRPLETHTWWMIRKFTAPAFVESQRWTLVFAGLDTLATVWLNGVLLGEADNMLIEARLDATPALLPGQVNTLAVRIDSALNEARRYTYEAASMSWEQREEGLYIRKAPHVWGWDIMPRAVSAGIWRPVWLEAVRDDAIEQLYLWTKEITPQGAVLGVRFQFRTACENLDGLSLRFRGVCDEHTFEMEWPVEFVAGGCNLWVPDARLWWPKGYGDANLYAVTVQLQNGDEILAERQERIGIRKLAVERTELAGEAWLPEPAGASQARLDVPANPNSHFIFYVNNQPIMIKGTNWVPLDAFHSRDAERLEPAIALVDDLGCNMIRCWGGNVYGEDRFFDLCDEKGILVWQDFAFACCRYPNDESFLEKVRDEIEAVVLRLRNHACLAIWCGDNEIDMAYLSDGLSPEQNRLTRQVIPQVIHRLDPWRAYVPSSPYAPPAVAQRKDAWQATPEQHLWGPRGYYKSSFYTRHSAHFIGEIGYHGCPDLASIRRFISPEKLWPWQNNDEWQVHAVYHWQHNAIDRDRIKLMANQVKELFGFVPEDIETFILASQITQAEAKKFFIESTRMRKWQTSGLLWWNVLDGWPQFSDAVVDYYFSKKLAYHYIWRAQRPVCVMIGEAGTTKYLPVVVCNDTLRDQEVRCRVWDADSQETLAAAEVTIPANQNWQVERIRTFASDSRMVLMEWEVDGHVYGNHTLVGNPPISLDRYRAWLGKIASLPRPFSFLYERHCEERSLRRSNLPPMR
jgi:beta-mannosidase